MGYDEAYYRMPNYFGAEPEEVLRDHYRRMDKSRPVLDIGAGQGRNTFFLAREGFVVDAIDPSEVAIQTISATMVREALPIRTACCGFERFTPKADCYSGVLVFGLIQELQWESIELLLERIESWTREGSYLFITAFTTMDPACVKARAECMEISRNSFRDASGQVTTYLEPGEALRLLGDWRRIYHWEGMGPEHRHGDGPLERHSVVEAVLRKPFRMTPPAISAHEEHELNARV